MLKVLHIVQSLNVGGLENGVVNLVNQADKNHLDVDVLCLRDKGTLAAKVIDSESRVHFDGNQSESILTAIKKVYALCKGKKYDIVHTHGWATMLPGYIGAKLAGIATIINGEHGTLYFSSKTQIIAQNLLFKLMDLNLSVSKVLIDEIKSKFDYRGDNFKAILNGVDEKKFSPDSTSRNEIRNSLNIGPDDFVVGSVGRLVEVKNYPCLIRAFAGLPSARQSYLVLAGYGDQQTKLEQLCQELGVADSVKFLGKRSDIPAIINSYDVFVLPSFREGLSNTILESLSCGVPVIASNVGGNPEMVMDGINGFLFESDNDQALIEKIASLQGNQDLLMDFSNKARKLVLESFTLDTMVDNYQSAYYELAERKV
ncbi:glycosyltransferase [Aliikangiella coralliicola]|uniref:glycosyltransferase n=1 Tax=Aliikangiella coralliicola TaxID=2592383 RepID=UPI00143DC18B|nr:glycosyltransferase [Aliikangiella coralliicola]